MSTRNGYEVDVPMCAGAVALLALDTKLGTRSSLLQNSCYNLFSTCRNCFKVLSEVSRTDVEMEAKELLKRVSKILTPGKAKQSWFSHNFSGACRR